ncbi:sensor histidine kinase [Halobacterium litoreum]|uniref:histidine kinase n=1 Tax=Halobacterium litoreum TaxID=2039234 RepID=A0ABD5NHW8_9EURY|nr:HAMP domain-containing sensor histidine kinase [Halobacterium litoreum]UHH12273.1 HAMP domain-containing histidine kinase [Halobacterium litoreum]
MADVRVLVNDRGNRNALAALVERGGHEVVDDGTAADLFVVDDRSLPEHRATLREETERRSPEFCPVVLVRRPDTRLDLASVTGSDDGTPRVVDETVTAPVDASVFFRRLSNLLVRQRQTRELAARNERLETFASTVAHEIRNPLNVVTGRLELARETGDEAHFDAMGRELERIDRLVDDVLALARTGDVSVDGAPVDLRAVVRTCWQAVDSSDATIYVDVDGAVLADEDRLTQLVGNLLRNAVEHGGEGVTVTVGDLDDCEGFYVADDGSGIPQGTATTSSNGASRARRRAPGSGCPWCRRSPTRTAGPSR